MSSMKTKMKLNSMWIGLTKLLIEIAVATEKAIGVGVIDDSSHIFF